MLQSLPGAAVVQGILHVPRGRAVRPVLREQYRYNTAILAGVIRHVTGLELERIEGDIRRPRRIRSIPIQPVPVAA